MDFNGFVGSAYNASASLQDNQISINYFVEMDKNDGAKEPKALLGAPGLSDLGQSVYTGQVRGIYVLANGNVITVIGSNVVLATPGLTITAPVFTYSLIGTLNTSTGLIGIRDNGTSGICVIVDGGYLYVYNETTQSFTISTDPAFLGSFSVIEIDGWFVFAKPNSQIFYTSPLYWDGIAPFDATYYALKDDAHDPIVSMIAYNRDVWLIGSETLEIWNNAGGNYFPFSRLTGTMQQIGCAATGSVAIHNKGVIWLGRSERGNSEVFMTQAYTHINVANPAISYAINQYPVVNDAIGYVYSEEGHEFYVLTFPTADVTWVYDFTTGEWHQRASYDSVGGQFHRQRANCAISFQNSIIAGDYLTGQIYQQSRRFFTDGDYPLVSVRRAPHMWDTSNRARIRYIRLQIEFKPGGASARLVPSASLRWSNDGGQTFGNWHTVSMGATGNTTHRVLWRRLGIARDRVFEVSVSDAVNRDITGASILGEIYKT